MRDFGLPAACTLRINLVENCPLKTERKLKKEDGGASDHYVSENGLLVMKWCDDKELIVASNHYSAEPTFPVRRWDKRKKSYVNIDLPALIRAYDKGMGGADQCTQLLDYYRLVFYSFVQGCGSGSAWIRIHFSSWIRIQEGKFVN